MDFWTYVALGLVAWAMLLCLIGFISDRRRGHSCTLPCVGARGHYGQCCCNKAHLWVDRRHGMKRP